MIFRNLRTLDRRNENRTHTLYDDSNGRYIKATWNDYHSAYDCEVTEIDENEQEITTTALLTDTDLGDCIIKA